MAQAEHACQIQGTDGQCWLKHADPDTEGIRELTRRLYADPDLLTTILPLRDGVAISLRR